MVAIGASTGGTVAVETIVGRLTRKVPPVVIVQHMPAYITKPFADRLAKLGQATVEEARDGQRLRHGLVLVAPGSKHLIVERSGSELKVRLREGPRVNGHCPSVDVLFRSVARHSGQRALGVLLTGMGKDGAEGLLEMRGEGAHTIAQDEATSVVFGMPKAAIELGAATEVAPLGEIATRMLRAMQRTSRIPAAV
jgi:two-component system chemotaxis response regulator CheB